MNYVHGKNSSRNFKVDSIGNPLDAKTSGPQKHKIPVEGGPAQILSLCTIILPKIKPDSISIKIITHSLKMYDNNVNSQIEIGVTTTLVIEKLTPKDVASINKTGRIN